MTAFAVAGALAAPPKGGSWRARRATEGRQAVLRGERANYTDTRFGLKAWHDEVQARAADVTK